TAGEQVQAPVKPREQGLRREEPDAGCCQLDRQWQTVQVVGDGRDAGRVLLGDLEVRVNLTRPLQKEAYRCVAHQVAGRWQPLGVGDIKRGNRDFPVSAQAWSLAAGDQKLELRANGEQLGQLWRGVDQMVEVVQQQEQVFVPQVFNQHFQQRVVTR